LGEGKYSELMRIYPESGSCIISWKTGWGMLGGVITQSYIGPLSDRGYWHALLFWITMTLSITPFYSTLKGWIPEEKQSSDETGIAKMCPGFMFDLGSFKQK
jgi:hypothetical protein